MTDTLFHDKEADIKITFDEGYYVHTQDRPILFTIDPRFINFDAPRIDYAAKKAVMEHFYDLHPEATPDQTPCPLCNPRPKGQMLRSQQCPACSFALPVVVAK